MIPIMSIMLILSKPFKKTALDRINMIERIGTARRRRLFAVLFSAVILSGIEIGSAEAHPLHTTLAQLNYDPVSLQLDASIRVFTSDLALAVAKRSGSSRPMDDAAAFAYLAATFQLADASGRVIAWTSCGTREEGDVTFLCVRAAKVPSSARVSDQMLCDLFDDQVNIVQAVTGGKKTSNLYTKGDGAKAAL